MHHPASGQHIQKHSVQAAGKEKTNEQLIYKSDGTVHDILPVQLAAFYHYYRTSVLAWRDFQLEMDLGL